MTFVCFFNLLDLSLESVRFVFLFGIIVLILAVLFSIFIFFFHLFSMDLPVSFPISVFSFLALIFFLFLFRSWMLWSYFMVLIYILLFFCMFLRISYWCLLFMYKCQKTFSFFLLCSYSGVLFLHVQEWIIFYWGPVLIIVLLVKVILSHIVLFTSYSFVIVIYFVWKLLNFFWRSLFLLWFHPFPYSFDYRTTYL